MNVEHFNRISEEYGRIHSLYSQNMVEFDDFAEFVTICLDFAGRKICDKYVEMIISFNGDIFDLIRMVNDLYYEIVESLNYGI